MRLLLEKLEDIFERFPILKERKKQKAGTLSEGVCEKIMEIHKTGTAVLWVAERDIEMVLELASRSYVMESGKITFEGTGKELLADKKFQDVIMGR